MTVYGVIATNAKGERVYIPRLRHEWEEGTGYLIAAVIIVLIAIVAFATL